MQTDVNRTHTYTAPYLVAEGPVEFLWSLDWEVRRA